MFRLAPVIQPLILANGNTRLRKTEKSLTLDRAFGGQLLLAFKSAQMFSYAL